jgi:hypothetical protein
MSALTDNPIVSIAFAIIAVAGAIVTITNPETLAFSEYVQDVLIGGGLLGIGRGIDSYGKSRAGN